MLQQTRRFGRDLPIGGIRQTAPLVNVMSKLVDDRRGIVLLLFGRKPLAFVENHLLLVSRAFSLSGFWNRRDELRAAAAFDDLLSRLPLAIKLPMARGVGIRGIEDGLLKKTVIHCRVSPGL